MARNAGRILTSHVGSLVRPDELLAFIARQQDGEPYDAKAYEECLRRSVADVVKKQVEAGVDIVSDGEYGKSISWSRYILDRLSGFEERHDQTPGFKAAVAGKDRRDFAEFYEEYEANYGFVGMGKTFKTGSWFVTGPIKYTGQALIQRDIEDIKRGVAGSGAVDAFMPLVAPASVVPQRTDEFYKSEEEALFAIADAVHEEYKAVIDAGLIAQIDDAFLASVYDVMVPPKTLAEYRKWAELRIEALNHALKGLPQDRTRYHICWGSWNGPHTNDVALNDIVDLVLRVNVGGYSLEMANPRHEHEWRVWETVKLPEGKYLLPGLVSHATNIVEHPELVAERIVRLAKLVGRERVVASTDCGFAQGPFARRVHPQIMWANLRALAEGARLATKELWH
jgi:5-methyltetrahydropteroyltriglutamate--homocysteine methyltransferase